jgi:hypothetical protein
MLQQGIIRPSMFAFSSPVLLVKKQDKSWHFCMDYLTLNAKMICNMFLIQWWMNSLMSSTVLASSPSLTSVVGTTKCL